MIEIVGRNCFLKFLKSSCDLEEVVDGLDVVLDEAPVLLDEGVAGDLGGEVGPRDEAEAHGAQEARQVRHALALPVLHLREEAPRREGSHAHNREFSQIENVDGHVNVGVESHPVGVFHTTEFQKVQSKRKKHFTYPRKFLKKQ